MASLGWPLSPDHDYRSASGPRFGAVRASAAYRERFAEVAGTPGRRLPGDVRKAGRPHGRSGPPRYVLLNAATTTSSTKATGIDAVFFSVTDVKKAIAFYRELLEIASVTFEGDHGAEFVLPDGSAFGVGAYSSGEHAPSGCVLFSVGDVEASAGRIEELGGKLSGETRDFPSCRAQWCLDPDGNSFVLHERKG
jgi:predicted enzyme related to lactoylglutathione lyase